MTVQMTALAALAAARQQIEQVAERVSQAGAPPGSDTVVLSEEMLELLDARAAFEIAVKLAETANEVERHTLDLLG